MPEEARDFWDLELLLKECARPTKYKGRIFAKDKLLTALAKLHDQSSEHLDPPRKIDKKGVREFKPKKELWEYEDYDDTVGGGGGKGGEKEKENDDAKDIGFEEEKGKGAVVLEWFSKFPWSWEYDPVKCDSRWALMRFGSCFLHPLTPLQPN